MPYQTNIPNAAQSPGLFPSQANDNFTRLTVKFKENRAGPIWPWISNGQESKKECFSRFNFNACFVAGFHALKKHASWENACIRIICFMAQKIIKYFWIKEMGYHILIGGNPSQGSGKSFAGRLKICRGHRCPGSALNWFAFAKNSFL